jgi:ComF family protein
MNYLYDLWDDFLSLLFPRLCYGCGNHLMRNENLICTECYVLIPRTDYHNIPDNPVAQLLWGRCSIEKAAAFSFYNKGSRMRKLIHNMKYKGIREVGMELGIIYGHSLKSSGFTDGIDFIIPVPLHPSKKRKRGFNQSEVIAEGISMATGIPVDRTSLIRSTKSDTQTKRSRYERWVNVEGIFTLSDKEALKGKSVLLIDDVITTGSTIESCANELLKTEGIKVSVAALAYAVM